jgi:drug/metabolite transporter (DMT)-like permease
VFLTRAFAAADASAVLPFDFSRLVFVSILGFVFFGERPDLWTWVGAGVIVAAAAYIAHRETVLGRRLAAAPPH